MCEMFQAAIDGCRQTTRALFCLHDTLVPTRRTQKPRVGFDSTLSRRRGDNVVRSNILITPLS